MVWHFPVSIVIFRKAAAVVPSDKRRVLGILARYSLQRTYRFGFVSFTTLLSLLGCVGYGFFKSAKHRLCSVEYSCTFHEIRWQFVPVQLRTHYIQLFANEKTLFYSLNWIFVFTYLRAYQRIHLRWNRYCLPGTSHYPQVGDLPLEPWHLKRLGLPVRPNSCCRLRQFRRIQILCFWFGPMLLWCWIRLYLRG